MPSYRLTVEARNDIASIAEYTINQFGVEQAIVYRDGLMRTFEFLAEFPMMARERTEIKPPVRAHPYKSHLIVYILDDQGVLILGIRHAREDWINELEGRNA